MAPRPAIPPELPLSKPRVPIGSYSQPIVPSNQKVYRNVRAKIRETLFGADCYAHGLMASGFIDVLLEANLKPYDYIASAAIVSGAGGKFTDWQGNELNLKSDGRIIAAGDAKIHNQLIKVIKKIK